MTAAEGAKPAKRNATAELRNGPAPEKYAQLNARWSGVTRWTSALAVLITTALPASRRAYAWPGENSLGKAGTTVDIEASDDRYPFCSTIDVTTARKMARKRFPEVRGASISASGRAMEVLAEAPWLGQLDQLWVCTDERGLRALARSRTLGKLIELQVASDDGRPFDAKAIRKLVSSRGLRSLERLRFSGSDSEAEKSIGSDGVIAIAEHAHLAQLRALDLSWNPIDGDAVASLVRSGVARQLEELNLCRTAMPTDAVITAKLTNLKRLCVSEKGSGRSSSDSKRLEAAYGAVLSPDVDWLDEP